MSSFPTSVVTTALLGGVANGIATTLSAGINNSVGTIPVLDTTGFPTAGYATIGTEIITYTGKTSNSLTGATRGVDSSAAASHSSGDAVNVYIVAAHISNLQNEVIAIEADISARFGIGASSNAIAIPSGVSLTAACRPQFNLGLNVRGGVDSVASITFGSDAASYTLTNSTTKRGQLGLPHYTSSTQKDVCVMACISTSTDNVVDIGGGSTTLTAATQIILSTATSNTSVAGGTQALFVDTNQRVIIGTGTARTINGTSNIFQVEGTAAGDARVSLMLNVNSAAGAQYLIGKSRGTTNGSNTIVQNGDFIGGFSWMGANGVDMSAQAAYIFCSVNGSPSSTSMPGQLDFATTPAGSIGASVAMSIMPTQTVKILGSGAATDGVAVQTLTLKNGNATAYLSQQSTTSVSTSATGIWTAAADSCLVIVTGDTSGGADIFCDLLWFGDAGPSTVISSFTSNGSPAARTYSNTSGLLKLAMGSGTYNINVLSFDLARR